MAKHVTGHVLADFAQVDRTAVNAGAQSRHLRRPRVRDVRRRLLTGMDAERSEEARQANELRADIAEAKQQVPVERELEGLVNLAAGFVPDTPPPEERFLRN